MTTTRMALAKTLFSAINDKDLDLANTLLPTIATYHDSGILDETDSDERSFLLCALDQHLPTFAQSLVDACVKKEHTEIFSHADKRGRTAILIAVEQGNITLFNNLLPYANTYYLQPNNNRETSLHYAASLDKPEIFDVLITKMEKDGTIKDHINSTTNNNQTPLYYALKKPVNAHIIASLLNCGSSLQTMADDKTTFDLLAIACSNNEILRKDVVIALSSKARDEVKRYCNTFKDDKGYPHTYAVKTLDIALAARNNQRTYGSVTSLFASPSSVIPASTQGEIALERVINDIQYLIDELNKRKGYYTNCSSPFILVQLLPYLAAATIYTTVFLGSMSKDSYQDLGREFEYFSQQIGWLLFAIGLASAAYFTHIGIISKYLPHFCSARNNPQRDERDERGGTNSLVSYADWFDITTKIRELLNTALAAKETTRFDSIMQISNILDELEDANDLTLDKAISTLTQLKSALKIVKDVIPFVVNLNNSQNNDEVVQIDEEKPLLKS